MLVWKNCDWCYKGNQWTTVKDIELVLSESPACGGYIEWRPKDKANQPLEKLGMGAVLQAERTVSSVSMKLLLSHLIFGLSSILQYWCFSFLFVGTYMIHIFIHEVIQTMQLGISIFVSFVVGLINKTLILSSPYCPHPIGKFLLLYRNLIHM